MDKETAVALAELKAKQKGMEKDISILEKDRETWNTLIRDTVIKTVQWLVGVGLMGIAFGWHLPDNIRKGLAEWMGK